MILDTTSKVIEIILGSAKTTNDCEFTADYVDTVSGSTFVPGATSGLSNGSTLVTAVASPAASTQRSIRSFTFYNADTVSTTVTVRIYDGTNRRRIVVVPLTPGQSLVYTPEGGWSTQPATITSGIYLPLAGGTMTGGLVMSGASITPDQADGIIGTTTNNNANAGSVGEYIFSEILVGSAVFPSGSGVITDITTISLTAGDWDTWANIASVQTGSPAPSFFSGWISTTSATFPTRPNKGAMLDINFATVTSTAVFPIGMMRLSLSATTTVYLTGQTNITGSGTNGFYGFLGARRVR